MKSVIVTLKLGGILTLLIQYPSFVEAALYNTTIQTQYGAVKGVPALNSTYGSYITNYQSITVWRGIPYAASTGGNNRWLPPQPPSSWNGNTLMAETFGPACPVGSFMGHAVPDDGYSEDCLSLNIWSAANSTAKKLPVMIWSHPALSTSADSLFDGAAMAAKGIVFVNYNYRDGPYGWLALPELWEESGNKTTGNYGMLDQFAALKWVRENIAAFGGDPNHITTVGQSAGSAAVYHTINSPLTKGLIVGAISESGIRDPHDPAASSLAESYNNLTYALSQGEEFQHRLNATSLAELRQLSMDDLNTASINISFKATLDGYAIPSTYEQQLRSGPANDVPVITGNTKDESGASTMTNVTDAEYQSTIRSTYGAFADRFLALYPASNNLTADAATNQIADDTSLVGSWLFGNAWAQTASSPFYTYYWTHAPPGQDQGAYHESEIPYVLNNLYGTNLPWTAEDYEISNTISEYWANFIKTGDPNPKGSGSNLTYWAPSTAKRQTTFHLNPPYGQVSIAEPKRVKLLEEFFQSRTPF